MYYRQCFPEKGEEASGHEVTQRGVRFLVKWQVELTHLSLLLLGTQLK